LGGSERIMGIPIISYVKNNLDLQPTWVITSPCKRIEFVSQGSTVSWYGMVARSVYRASHACSYVETGAALCSSWLESAEPQRTVRRVEYSWSSTLDTGFICKCVLPAQHPVLFRTVQTPSIPWEQHLWYVPYWDLAGYNNRAIHISLVLHLTSPSTISGERGQPVFLAPFLILLSATFKYIK
jgi:hypothetical protein